MAKLTAPLFSLDASGTIAKAITFSRWKGIKYARTRVIPNNPDTLAQQEVRGVFSTLSEMWKRMPLRTRQPFTEAVAGLPMTDRNKHVQLNVPALQNDVNLDDLVMSVSSGQSVPPAAVTSDEVPAGSIQLTITAPIPPPGYTIGRYDAAAIQDGDPSPVLIRQTFEGNCLPPALVITIAVLPLGVDYQWAVWIQYNRTSDAHVFFSAAVRGQQAIAP